VAVRLNQYDGRVGFAVEDDGCGFDVAGTPPGSGLTNLADRVAAVGGTLRIDSWPGEGTRITGDLPASPPQT
jgi:signal transduction histidine kinase